LFSQLQASTLTPENLADERPNRKLNWAAQLHEIGSHISHSDYHKHGAYILDNADAMGFALSELHKLSLLVLGHRGKLRKLEVDFEDDCSCNSCSPCVLPSSCATPGATPI